MKKKHKTGDRGEWKLYAPTSTRENAKEEEYDDGG